MALPPDPSPVDDQERLDALASYGVLDTPPEEGFDDIVHLASQLCGTPVALVSLVDRDRQWFKARLGFPHVETPLEQSVCAHALGQNEVLVVPDLTQDERTAHNPLVSGDPHIRFYAGAPLVSPQGQVLGTLCVIDHTPRPEGLNLEQMGNLQALARQVMSQLELRRALRTRDGLLTEQERMMREREALGKAQQAIAASGGDFDHVCEALVTAAMAAVPVAEAGVIEILDGDELEYRAVRGSIAHHLGLRVPLRASLAGRCVITKTAILVDDAREDGPRQDLVEMLGLRSAVFAPVTRGGEVLGVLKLQSSLPGAFSARDLQVTELFAGVASAGLAEVSEAAARREVEASESRYKAVFDSAVDYAIVVMDLGGLVVDWNVGAERTFGWTLAEMRGKPARQIFTPEDRAHGVPEHEMRIALERSVGINERWHVRSSGERFWANGELMALRDGSGGVIGFTKILRDRTEQRESLERLTEHRSQLALERSLLRGVLQQAPIGISLDFADGRTLFNARAEQMIGAPDHGAIQDRVFRAVRGNGQPMSAADHPTMRALYRGEVVEGEPMRYRARSGEDRRLDVFSAPIRDETGAVSAAVSVFVDMEDQLRATEALQASEAHWRGLFQQLREGFVLGRVIRDSSGKIADWRYLEVNRAWGELVGVSSEAAAGRTIREVFPGIEDTGVEEFAHVVDTGESVTFTHQIGRFDRWYEGRAHKISSDTFVVLFLEVTERVRADRLQRASERRKGALIELGDRLRDLSLVADMTRVAAEIVGRTLEVTRAGFGRLDASGEYIDVQPDWTAPGVASIAGRHRLADYGSLRQELNVGEPLVVDDVQSDPRTSSDPSRLVALDIRSLINTPVRERGRTVAVFLVHHDRPRDWTEEEVGFLRTVADRVGVGVARLRAEEEQQLLNHELSHRLKNTLAMVQAIVSQTLRNASDLPAAGEALSARIMALGKAHDILLSGTSVNAQLSDVIAGALAPHADQPERITLDGPPVLIDERASLSLALMVHELATNAAKYGALSLPSGRVGVTWSVEDDTGQQIVRLQWKERGGPPVAPPSRRGFGSRLIQRGLAGAVGGTVTVDYLPLGVQCVLTAPLSGLQSQTAGPDLSPPSGT